MNRCDMVRRMLEAIPNVRVAYDALVEWYDGEVPGPHVVFGDVLNPYLVDMLRPNAGDAALADVFALLEEMATSEDTVVQEVLATTVLERLGDDPAVLERARRYMGPATRRLSDKVEQWWGRGHAMSDNSAGRGKA